MFVVVHGGGFTSGSRSTPAFDDLCTGFALRGYVAISIDYRLVPLGTSIALPMIRDTVHDYQAAIRWLRANAAARGIDPDRIAVIGSSAGAITVLESAYAARGEVGSGNPGYSSRVHVVIDLWVALLIPTAMLSTQPPVMIVHGTNDMVVPFLAAQ